jgi:hypothetical protein
MAGVDWSDGLTRARKIFPKFAWLRNFLTMAGCNCGDCAADKSAKFIQPIAAASYSTERAIRQS